MPCTTILVGKKASYDGSTIIARNDDSGSGHYTSKKLAVIKPEEQPKIYKSVISHVKIELPEHPMRYTAMPNAEEGEGIWAACGMNEAHVGMTATETITSNPRVLGADPLVRYQPAKDGKEEISKTKEDAIITEPIVLLVNSSSASASEIMAGALKDLKCATIVGTKTYGKGVIQQLLSLKDGSGLKVTVEEYYTPNRTKINGVGIEPDEKVELPESVTNILLVKDEEDTQLQKAVELLSK